MASLKAPVTPGDHIRGGENASVTLLQYGDYGSPECALTHLTVKYVEQYFDGEVKIAYRHFPDAAAHPCAETAAEFSELASDHGKFWKMHELICMSREFLTEGRLVELGTLIGLSREEMQYALQKRIYSPKVREDRAGGVRSGVTAAP